MNRFALSLALATFGIFQVGTQVRAQDVSGALAMFETNPVPFPELGGFAKPSVQPPPAAPYGDITVAGTGLAVTNGFSNRFVAEEAANVYYSGWGFHLDTAHDWREENADYVVGGLSYAVTPYIRPKILVGTSSDNLDIQPQAYFRGEIEFQSPGSSGTTGVVAIPSITSREYRNGVKETVPEIDVAYYLPELPDHTYFVVETKAAATFVAGVSGVGYEFSTSTTYVSPKWGTIGAEVFGGRMVYDNTLCVTLCSVDNRFLGVRPLVSFYLNHSDKLELFVRGEIVATDFYNIYGGTVGLKTRF